MSEALIAQLQKENGELKSENHKYRGRIRQLRSENETLTKERDEAREAGKPKDGTVVLDAEAAQRWTAYEAIGKKPEEIVSALSEGEQARGKLAEVEWSEKARKAADLAGFENPEAFLAFPGVKDLSFEVRTEKVDGKDVERAYVKSGNETKPLDMDFVDSREDWKALKGALGATGATKPASGPTFTRERPERRTGKEATEEDFRKATESTATYQL